MRLDTYNENFIKMNNDKLTYKIKQLMKERFFYRKKDLVVLLNVLKPYPLVQINAALQQLVEDKTEYITDKYGRLGQLINVGDLYLFQPLELNEPHSSIYERSVPLMVKHDKINVKLPKEIKVNEAIIKIKEVKKDETTDLYTKLEQNYTMAIMKQVVVKGEKNWYMFFHLCIDFLVRNGFQINVLYQLLAEHMVDELYLSDILVILNDFQENPRYDTQDVFKYIKTYMAKQILTAKGLKGFLWREKNKQVLLVKSAGQGEDTTWHVAEPEDLKDFQPQLAEREKNIRANLNQLMGFMNNFKTEDYVVFKIKDINNPRDSGARCDQSSKSKANDILNDIVGVDNYKEPPSKNISQKELCILQELYLRFFDRERKDKKRWFLSPPEAVLMNIEKYSTVVKKGKKKAK